MNCRNHPDTAAVSRCTGCAEPFCFNCSVEVRGQPYCSDCKMMAVEGTPTALLADDGQAIPCTEAWEALKYALIGFVCCFYFVTGPLAIIKGLEARRIAKSNPAYYGIGVANAAIAIGSIQVWIFVLGLVGRGAQ
ncbi:MAG: hypothetical protein HY319_13880 [Armatimonadetes bacterium]|nr:hypothetical protein [Armatimonadota bacterium]